MQMDVWYDMMLQEMVDADPTASELLEDAELALEPERTGGENTRR